ncbi:MAG: NAD(P)(+) transhydrogenase (Re/Si-specific) subunit alpha, partial [Bacteroidota bacterium]
MVVGVLKEVSPETRVSLIAEGVAQLTKKQIKVWVESGAGMNAFCSDEDYLAAGAEIKSSQEIADHADVVLS